MTVILGITGSMAMGKSTVAQMAADMVAGAWLIDADKVVHQLLDVGGAAVAAVSDVFPDTVRHNEAGEPYIDRKALGGAVFGNPDALGDLESIMHHRVRAANLESIKQARLQRVPLVVLEIPLLFETEAQAICDAVWVASAPAFLQKRRAFKRPGMTAEKFRAALARQMPDVQKRRLAHAVIPTGLGKAYSYRVIRRLMMALLAIDSVVETGE